MVSDATLKAVQQAGWNIASFDTSPKATKAIQYREARTKNICAANASRNDSAALAVVSGVVGCFFWPALVVTAGSAFWSYGKHRAGERIDKASELTIKASQDIFYFEQLQAAIKQQQREITHTPHAQRQAVVDKTQKMWQSLGRFITELENPRNEKEIRAFRQCKTKLLDELEILQSNLAKKKITKTYATTQSIETIKTALQECLGKKEDSGLIRDLIHERRCLCGHLHDRLLDDVEFVT